MLLLRCGCGCPYAYSTVTVVIKIRLFFRWEDNRESVAGGNVLLAHLDGHGVHLITAGALLLPLVDLHAACRERRQRR